MSELKLCRICLRTDGKMYKYNQYELEKCYDRIMLKIDLEDDLPRWFCYECAGLLYKFNKFREKCHNGHKILKDMAWRKKITYSMIQNLDRKRFNLESQINLIVISDRVRTDTVIHATADIKTKSLVVEIPCIENITVENHYIDAQYDHSVNNDDRNYDSDYDPIDNVALAMINDVKPIETYPDDVKVPIHAIDTPLDNKIDMDFIKDKEAEKKTLNNTAEITIAKLVDEKKLTGSIRNDIAKKLNDSVENDKKNKSNIKNSKRRKKLKEESTELEKKKFKLDCKKNKFLESNNWSRTFLSEEEAEKEFNMKAENIKYLKAPFKCTQCFKGFSQQDMLTRHNKLRHDESLGPLECRFCKMRFKWKCNLTKHMPRHYTIYKCLRCDLVCNLDTSAEFHENYHNGIIRKCKLCGKEFKHQSTYYSHLRTHRSAHVCHRCGASFVSRAGLHMHRLIKHVDINNPEVCERDAGSGAYCSRCNIQFESRRAHEEHLYHSDMHSAGLPDHIDDGPAPAGPKYQRRPRPARRIPSTCSYCGETFPTLTGCMKHHRAKHWRKPFSPDQQRHICEICGASLAAASVIPHLNTHTRAQLFDCGICELKFSCKSSLKRHMLTHTGEKPFACPVCAKRFTQTGSVKLHYRTVHLKEPHPKRNRRKKKDEIKSDSSR